MQSTHAHLADADTKIVFDKFHVVKHLHDAVDQVRRAEHRHLRREGDERLTGSKYLWCLRPGNMSVAQRQAFRALQHQDLKVARAWTLKEHFRAFWDYTYSGAAQNFFARWYWRATPLNAACARPPSCEEEPEERRSISGVGFEPTTLGL